MVSRLEAEPLMADRFALAEGPLYHADDDTLWFVDIHVGKLYVYDLETGVLKMTAFEQALGAAVPTRGGRVLVALTTGVYLFDGEELRPVCCPPELTPAFRLNDAKCDAAGRFWFGTLRIFPGRGEDGSLFCCYPGGGYRKMQGGITTSNGMDWSPDGKTLYYIDTGAGGVDAFEFEPESGAIANRRRVFTPDAGHPDGMTVDAEGMLWVALWGGDRVVRCHPATGQVLAEIPLPAHLVTCCCFGGKDMDTLYITTAAEGSGDAGAGRLYVARPGVRGKPPHYFDDSHF